MSSFIKTLTFRCFGQHNSVGATTNNHSPGGLKNQNYNLSYTKTTTLQLFIRMMSNHKIIVIHALREDTVNSLLTKISSKTKIPIQYLRLLYKSKNLPTEKTLIECGVENESNLQLVGCLMSIGCAVVWQATNEIVSLIMRLIKGDFVLAHFAATLISTHFTMYIDDPHYLGVLMFMRIPSRLIALYTSQYARNKTIAESSIKKFVDLCVGLKCKILQLCYCEVLLEFCELLRGVGSKCEDPLYVYCRSCLSTLLKHTSGVFCSNLKQSVLLKGVFACLSELAYDLLKYLDSSMKGTSVEVSSNVVSEFINFSTTFRTGIAEQQASYNEPWGIRSEKDSKIVEAVAQFRILFILLLKKMDECLQVMEDCLVNKKKLNANEDEDDLHYGWYRYITILKELYHISKLYSGAEEMFWGVLLHRKTMLSHLIVQYVEETDDHRWILQNRNVTDFESRRHLAIMLFPNSYGLVAYEMLISRSEVLVESFEYISKAMPKSLEYGLFMQFKDEVATGPGVVREWCVLVCQEIFNPKNALFVACPNDHRRFFPNAASDVNPLHLKYFKFSGRMIALALKNKVHVGIVFDRVFFKQLAGNSITLEDIQDADPIMYHSCKKILEMDAYYIDSDALGLTFSIEVEQLGQRKVIELCLGGETLVVDSKNRATYVDLLIQNRFVTSISDQVSHFSEGFADVISGRRLEFFQTLDLEDLDWMLHGSENVISVEDWKAHTQYNVYKEIDHQISWFWEIVGRMSSEQKKVLLFFWTSVKHLPVEGFRGLSSCLYICKSSQPENHLPSSHTCFYQLCFPPYSSMDIMQDRLTIITQDYISSSFGNY